MTEEHIPFDQPAFKQKYLEGEVPREQRVVAVKVNSEEEGLLEEVKQLLNCPYDSTILKLGLRQLRKVLLEGFDSEVLRYLVSERRNRRRP